MRRIWRASQCVDDVLRGGNGDRTYGPNDGEGARCVELERVAVRTRLAEFGLRRFAFEGDVDGDSFMSITLDNCVLGRGLWWFLGSWSCFL